MLLRCRPAVRAELEECLPCIRDKEYFKSDQDCRDLVKMWTDLMDREIACTSVIEDLERSQGQRIVYFCLNVAVTEVFVHRATNSLPPGIGFNLLQNWRNKGDGLLTREQVAAANAGKGLSVCVLHSGMPDSLMYSPEGDPIRDRITSWIVEIMGGYRYRHLLIESYDEWQDAWSLNAGFLLRTDYPNFPHSGARVGLYGLTREEATERQGSAIKLVFNYLPPRFGLSHVERMLCLFACGGLEDSEIAEKLSISPSTVKQRWKGVIEKFNLTFPSEPSPDGKRGSEKRGRILEYLRHHVEELRPYRG
ncbi:MAG: hypothetical protein H7308_10920 [Chthonomonadaceae bacterium]|nr:hypothetical protein [Chthonomonadaceae bacterium]